MNRPYETEIYETNEKYYLQAKLSQHVNLESSDTDYVLNTWERISGDNMLNLINGVWVVPYTGVYRITMNVTFTIANATSEWTPKISIVKNGNEILSTETIVARPVSSGVAIEPLNCNIINELIKGDNITAVASVIYSNGSEAKVLRQHLSSLNFERIN